MNQPTRRAAAAGYHDNLGSHAVSSAPPQTSKRDRIIEAALKLFANESYQAVTMDRVAESAGVAKGTLYLYFQSKEDLYLGILTDGMESMVRDYQASVDANADVKARLRHAVTMSVEFYDRRRDLLRLMMTEEPRMPAARNRIRDEWRDRGVKFFNSLIEEGIQSGVFRAVDSLMATYAIMGGIRSVMLFYGAHHPVDRIVDELGETMVRGLLNDSSATHRKVARS
jgi:AcrR family transcriptional regulator